MADRGDDVNEDDVLADRVEEQAKQAVVDKHYDLFCEAARRLRGAPEEGAGEGGMEREMGDSNSDVRDLSDEELVGPMEELGVRYCLDVGLATVPVLLHAAEIIRRLEGRQAEWAEQWAETVHQHLETLRDEGLHVERKHLAMAFNDLVGPFDQYGVSDEGLRTGREGEREPDGLTFHKCPNCGCGVYLGDDCAKCGRPRNPETISVADNEQDDLDGLLRRSLCVADKLEKGHANDGPQEDPPEVWAARYLRRLVDRLRGAPEGAELHRILEDRDPPLGTIVNALRSNVNAEHWGQVKEWLERLEELELEIERAHKRLRTGREGGG